MDQFYLHHVLHSLTIAAEFEFPDGYEVLDLGTGGGFPGVPLAIMFPKVNFLLADSINKKLKVVNAACEELGVAKAFALHGDHAIGDERLITVLKDALDLVGHLPRGAERPARAGTRPGTRPDPAPGRAARRRTAWSARCRRPDRPRLRRRLLRGCVRVRRPATAQR